MNCMFVPLLILVEHYANSIYDISVEVVDQ